MDAIDEGKDPAYIIDVQSSGCRWVLTLEAQWDK